MLVNEAGVNEQCSDMVFSRRAEESRKSWHNLSSTSSVLTTLTTPRTTSAVLHHVFPANAQAGQSLPLVFVDRC